MSDKADRVVAPGVQARLWDGPTRVVHWALVALLAFSWWSAEEGNLEWHRWSGYAVLGLLVFRIYWGFAGSASSRFGSFVKGPRATLAYLKTIPRKGAGDVPGHNPAGAWSVVAILLAILMQVTTGLFAVDVDGLESGPLSYMVDFDTGRIFAEVHEWSFTAIQVLVVLHVAAIAFYMIYKKNNLIGPMITGRRRFESDPGLTFAPWWRLVLGAVIAFAIMWAISKGLRV